MVMHRLLWISKLANQFRLSPRKRPGKPRRTVKLHQESLEKRVVPATIEGHFGMQELGNGKKLLLFSVWNSGQNDPKAVAADKRVKLRHQDAKVRIGRFGGEGTGGQSFS